MIDVEQSNLMLYNQYLEQMKAAAQYPTNHGVHPFTHLKEKFRKLFSRHKNEPQHDHKGIYISLREAMCDIKDHQRWSELRLY